MTRRGSAGGSRHRGNPLYTADAGPNCSTLPDSGPGDMRSIAGARRVPQMYGISGDKARSAAEHAEPAEGRRGSPSGSRAPKTGVAA